MHAPQAAQGSPDALLQHLRDATDYAVIAGLLKDGTVLATRRAADAAQAAGTPPDLEAIQTALNTVAPLVAPLTLTDLSFGRNPLSPENQRRTRQFQFWLPVLALVMLVHIGYFMHSLRIEQTAVTTLERIEASRPQQKLVALRKMAQFESPLSAQSAMRDQYYEKVAELMSLNGQIASTYEAASQAYAQPLFPLSLLLAWRPWASDPGALPPAGDTSVQAAAQGGGDAAAAQATAAADTLPAAAPDVCEEAQDGSIRLTQGAERYPQWIRSLLADNLSHWCFQLRVFSADGSGSVLSQSLSLSQSSYYPYIKEKIALRTDWFLPFLYGLLGSTLFLMRTVGNIRLPAMEAMPILMRIALGGMAGIVIGWFSVGEPASQTHIAGAISLPFALAFVVGYGIDALFAILDRLNKLIGDISAPRPAAN